MTHNIHPNLESLALPIEKLVLLPTNPRRGDVDAIAASLNEFGQLKAVVVRPNDDDTYTVVAGNHTVQAAQANGWTEIAAVQFEADDDRSIAFALTDNRTSELGHTDSIELDDLLGDMLGDYSVLMEDLGWDDFELAALNETAQRNTRTQESVGGYTAPELILPDEDELAMLDSAPLPAPSDDVRIVAPQDTNVKDAIVHGATATAAGAGAKGMVQYNLVFDSTEQQRRWHEFLRWLKTDAEVDGDTTAERLLSFLEPRADF